MGYLGAVMAVGTVAGPLLGGVITDGIGWRWCFYVGVPIAVAAIVVLQRTLNLPHRARRDAHIDFPGAVLISRRRLAAADLGLVRRHALRLGLVADRRDGRRRDRAARLRGPGRAPRRASR